MTITLYGTLQEDGTLHLDDKVNGLPPGRVKVVVEEAVPVPERSIIDILEEIHRDQKARGFKGRSAADFLADEVAAQAEAEEYDEYWRQIWAQTVTGCPPWEETC